MQNNSLGVRHKYKLEKIKEVLSVLAQYPQICFRGGTSLSLCYQVIERFSEDIDISIFKGEYSIETILQSVIDKINEFEWVTNINKWDEKLEIEINFLNDKPKSSYSNQFSDSKIIIEYPKVKRSKEDLKHNIMEPYPLAPFKMPVMDIGYIFTDKVAIIMKKFSKTLNFSWALESRAAARHIYDVQILSSKKKILTVDEEHFPKLVFLEFLKKDSLGFRGTKKEVLDNQKYFFKLSNENALALFKKQLKKDSKEIKLRLSRLIYPGSETINLELFLKNFEPIFKYVFKYIKTEYKKSLE